MIYQRNMRSPFFTCCTEVRSKVFAAKQAWIKRIVRHIQKVIELEGGNEYREGAIEALRRLKAPKAGEDK